jgi:hypothetical protein
MSAHDRQRRRREAPTGHEPEQPVPAPTPDAASILALQRSAGNRAVLSRFIYNPTKKHLHVPSSYGDQAVPWDETTKMLAKAVEAKATAPEKKPAVKGRQVKTPKRGKAEPEKTQAQPTAEPQPQAPKAKTLATLANEDATFRGHLKTGLNVEALDTVTSIADAQLQANAATLADKEPADGTVDALKAVAVDTNRLLTHYSLAKYKDKKDLDISWVMSSPNDFVPGANDLPPEGGKVRDPTGGDVGETYWEFMCVLIASIKDGGWGRVKELTGVDTADLQVAVQAMNDFYFEAGVMYDDSSARFRVMKDFGYTLMWAGNTPWENLPAHVTLAQGKSYLFDIPGHTFKVDVNREWPKPDAKGAFKPKNFFTTHSEEDNYEDDEMDYPVTFIWVKSG